MSTTEMPMAASVARFVARLVIGLPSTISRSARKAPTATRYHPIRRFRRRAGSKGVGRGHRVLPVSAVGGRLSYRSPGTFVKHGELGAYLPRGRERVVRSSNSADRAAHRGHAGHREDHGGYQPDALARSPV